MSKALEKSINNKSVCCWLFIDRWISSIKSTSCVWQEWLGLNPCCRGFKVFSDVKKDIIW